MNKNQRQTRKFARDNNGQCIAVSRLYSSINKGNKSSPAPGSFIPRHISFKTAPRLSRQAKVGAPSWADKRQIEVKVESAPDAIETLAIFTKEARESYYRHRKIA